MQAGYLQFGPVFANTAANIEKIKDLTENISFDLLVMPELSNSGYLFAKKEELEKTAESIPEGIFCKYLKGLASEKNAYIVCGLAEVETGKYYNSSVLVYPDGNIKRYRKIHLFSEEKRWFLHGESKFNVHDIYIRGENVKVGMMICYDWIYPESARSLAMQGAQVICHPSNLVMPYCQSAMFARAVENRVFTITANRIGRESNDGNELYFTGQSVIVDPKGNYLQRGSEDGEECIVIDIDPKLALDKKINDYNSIFEDRREDMYTS